MSFRLLGAALIIAGCGGFGISLVMGEKHREKLLHRLLSAITFMQWELEYRLTPLPELLRLSARQAGGEIGRILNEVSQELELQVLPDVSSCMLKILGQHEEQPYFMRSLLRKLGSSLGNFDLSGQLLGLKAAEEACQAELKKMEEGKSQRYRSYETLGFCAGAALVILFI